ncbi:MAG: thioredoxin family protein [Akkermansia sp.]
MKTSAFLSVLACLLCIAPMPVVAQHATKDTPAANSPKKAKDSADKNVVVTAAKKCKLINGKPSEKASYYFYLFSASWCGPCQREMPEIVKAHKEMKKDGRCDIILIGADKSVADMKAYVKSHKAKFGAIWKEDKDVKQMPGISFPPGIPYVNLVSADGKCLYVGHANCIRDWKQLVDQADARKAESAEPAEQPDADAEPEL